MNPTRYLCDIFPGQTARVSYLFASGSMRRRLQDLGCLEDTPITCLGRSPFGDPSAFLIRGSVIALRKKDSQKILVTVKD